MSNLTDVSGSPDEQNNMLTQLKRQTVAVILCYGDRQDLISQIALRLLEMGIESVLIVTNEVSSEVNAVVARLVGNDRRFHQLNFVENLGSAGAYARSLEYAVHHFQDARFF